MRGRQAVDDLDERAEHVGVEHRRHGERRPQRGGGVGCWAWPVSVAQRLDLPVAVAVELDGPAVQQSPWRRRFSAEPLALPVVGSRSRSALDPTSSSHG